MPARERMTRANDAGFLERLQLPVRGLADGGASEIVGHALRDLPGVATITLRVREQVVDVTYDPAMITADAIRDRMHVAGLIHPERDAGAHDHEGPDSDAAD